MESISSFASRCMAIIPSGWELVVTTDTNYLLGGCIMATWRDGTRTLMFHDPIGEDYDGNTIYSQAILVVQE